MFAVAAAFISCSKAAEVEDQTTVTSEEEFTIITLGIESVETKTDLYGTKTILWGEGDAISVDTQSDGPQTFTLVSGSGTGTATFSHSGTVTIGTGRTTFYPASMNPNYSSGWHVTLPDTYAWSQDGIKAPMYAWIANGYDYFKLMTGVLKLDIYNIPAAADKLVFTTVDQQVSGDMVFDGTDVDTSADDTNKTITITFTAGEESARSFFIPLPVGTYASGATVELKNSSDVTLVKKTAPSITVARGDIVYLPAIACSTVSTVLWEGTKEFTTWADWDSVPAWSITGIWSTFTAGNVLKFNFSSVSSGCWFKVYYKDADWNWQTLFEEGVAEGSESYTHTLTSEDIVNLSIRNYMVISSQNCVLTSIEVIDNKPESVLWKGSLDLGTDDSWENNLMDLGSAFWANVSAGKIITVYYTEKSQTNDWRPLQLQYMGSPWVTFADGGHNVDGTKFFSYKLTSEDAANLKSYGLAINGTGLIVTKITLK